MNCYMFNDDVIRMFFAGKRNDYQFTQRYNYAMKMVGKLHAYMLYVLLSKHGLGYRWYGPKNVKVIPFMGYIIDREYFKSV